MSDFVSDIIYYRRIGANGVGEFSSPLNFHKSVTKLLHSSGALKHKEFP